MKPKLTTPDGIPDDIVGKNTRTTQDYKLMAKPVTTPDENLDDHLDETSDDNPF
jgi:hypothetical protein